MAKKKIVRLRFDDPWFHLPELAHGEPEKVRAVLQLAPVTPGQVRSAIEAAFALGFRPHQIMKVVRQGDEFVRAE